MLEAEGTEAELAPGFIELLRNVAQPVPCPAVRRSFDQRSPLRRLRFCAFAAGCVSSAPPCWAGRALDCRGAGCEVFAGVVCCPCPSIFLDPCAGRGGLPGA